MKLFTRKRTPAEQLKHAALEAAVSALGDLEDRSKGKPALSGMRAVGTGAVLFTAARTAFKGRQLLREQLSSSDGEDDETTEARAERVAPQADEQAEATEEKEQRPDAAEPEAADEDDRRDDEPDDRTGSKPARRAPDRKPARRPARRNGSQPSLELPQQRWPRMSASKR